MSRSPYAASQVKKPVELTPEEMKVAGDIGETAFKAWLDGVGISFVAVSQATETSWSCSSRLDCLQSM